MIDHKLKKLPKKTYEIDITIPTEEVQEEYKKAFEHMLPEFTMEGYRKGKVPRALAEKNIKKDAVYQHAIRDMLPRIYDDIVKKENLRPIVSPRIELVKANENEPWEIKVTVAEKPEIELGNYKEKVKKALAEVKKPEIWVPGKDQKEQEKNPDMDRQKQLNEILTVLIKEVKCDISDLVTEEELNNRLGRLVDDVQKVGLTVESYLKSRNMTMDQLKDMFKKEIEETYKIEFILMEIAEAEKISVDQGEIEALFKNITDPKERQAAESNAYLYASVLRKQKVLDFLTSL